ncbi:transcriptional regulator with XRE-family HTH domain [Clostridium acetobutylicum]|uniref:Predicted transcriptional regulator n=1 Tax=Clostridium acetobutylicum (strain ATCC 824 / DSM 792 / JCM 1419 / IAM 19013 / LMG 5710 / NBRC 13948 / NRRL B-527 / VKM B-1787 / 2291 / W) TaxID=272562 RepID=Q97IR2_CLOAB|nr:MULTISPECIES: helix-turn-helix transcriptional regulator [Clostridium]AAK79545.1 Predicted transcriptional regulator [Clostridium acetobutylicum ATCC 824]ADZ20630.1 transcriptional regulator [Clostridium acetobutylicum EA 2018]AEI31878.1 transcriptional regulator [Clostridium acetobutylicum DSM 1731]AWV81212.1 XRE family transcriptional regulator [Clostridium acetobutylicum]KHD36316.1 XRE family transcriptional regulator [Clostridium acetobutylicum]
MYIDYSIIGDRIRNSRKSKNYTQENLAEYLDVSTVYVSKIECGKTKINLETLMKICKFLNITPSYILTGSTTDSENYQKNEITDMLKTCPPEKIKLISSMIKLIVNFEKK